MKVISKALILPKEEYFKKHLLIINPLLPIPLQKNEIEVLAAFIEVQETLGELTFETTGRKEVREKLGLSYGGLGNYLKKLKDKGYLLVNKNGKLVMRDILIPQEGWQGYQFKLEIK